MSEETDHDKEVAKYREAAKKKTTMPKGDVGHDIHKRAVQQYNKQNPSTKVKEELSIDDQMRIARDAAKDRNPNPDHKAIRAKQIKNSKAPKDKRTDAQKMADAYASVRKGPGGERRAD